jgi:Uma2 family endonuclease
VEVICPHELFDDVSRHLRDDFTYGVRQVWVVWPPEREVLVYNSGVETKVLRADDTLASEAIPPGFELKVSELFG